MQSPLHTFSPSPQRDTSTRGKKKVPIACNTCRSRRTRCGRQRPVCAFCRARGLDCQYEQPPPTQPSSIELELAGIKHRLDCMTELLCQSQTRSSQSTGNDQAEQEEINDDEKSPFKLLGTQRMMSILGLDANFARQLVRLERTLPKAGTPSSRLYMVTHQQAVTALAAFSAHIHVWYPIFRPNFSAQYFRAISGPLIPSPETCVTLLVTTIGLVAHNATSSGVPNTELAHTPYFEAATASLLVVLTDDSLESVHSLILLSIYYCCLSRPCHAHDYCVIASFKIQNLLQRLDENDNEDHERLKRAYWAVLLLESELSVQFDVAKSGIWRLDDKMALPDGREAWQLDLDVSSPLPASTSPASVFSATSSSNDKVQSYFLAEISMRRMLHRCNTAIRRTSEGKVVYAPGIALELELQLDRWYDYLPEVVRFKIDLEHPQPLGDPSFTVDFTTPCPLSNFLRVQYHCCKISIYWPAVYQAIQDGAVNHQLLDHCCRFFYSYVRLIPSIVAAFHECIVNRWTLFASIFMSTMAALKGLVTPCLRSSVDSTRLRQCFALTRSVNRRMVEMSPSLTLLSDTLEQKLAAECPSPDVLYDTDTLTLLEDECG